MKRLLDSPSATAEIAGTPALLAEARRILPSLEARARWPSGVDGVKSVIGRRFSLYPQPDRSDALWAAWWADYIEALKDVPQPALEAAMTEWVRKPDSQFLPKPGELRAMALQTVTREALAYDRARKAVDAVQPFQGERLRVDLPEPKRPPTTKQDRERVKAWAAEFKSSVDAKERPMPPVRANQAVVDETGISPGLRALVEQQREQA